LIERRRAGVLAHVTSFPGPGPIGDLGSSALRFLDWAAAAGFSVWQLLPLHPLGSGGSPYDARSAFAGNTLLLSLEPLARDDRPESDRIDLEAAARRTDLGLAAAWHRFRERPDPQLRAELDAFLDDRAVRSWLDDWAAYAVLRRHHGGRGWNSWDEALRRREPQALARALAPLSAELDLERFAQFLFRRQWRALRQEASRRGFAILGDLPFYIALDSADVWAHPELFALDERGQPTHVGGVPPDLFSATGQRWGQPVYRWDRMAEDGYAWWIERVRSELALVDLLRLDHFRGFVAYWEIEATCATAEIGRWAPGPGRALFDALGKALGSLPFVAEDLGVITPDVAELRDEIGLPGLHVAQFAFGEDADQHRRASHRERDVVCSGTHDNDTLAGWLAALDADTRARVTETIPAVADGGAAALVEWVYASPCRLSVVPLQDLLGLGSAARMNLPGRAAGNWTWRARASALTDERAASLLALAARSGRTGRC
jgi:4-alpha-glucanotransferase